MSNPFITEQAIISALQAMAANPDYSDIMRTIEQHWPDLGTTALPQFTIPNLPAPCVISIPNANPATDQPGHPQYGASERSRSPSCASTSSQTGGAERNAAQNRESVMSAPQLDQGYHQIRT